MRAIELACRRRSRKLRDTELPLDLDALVPGDAPWELEVGFGKGRYLLARAVEAPPVRLLGIEMAAKYFRLVERRSAQRGIDNVVLVLGEALYAMGTILPPACFAAAHVYFPDPWPKDRHHKRRLFDADTVDLLLALIEPGGQLFFASDHLEYAAQVADLLESHPALSVERLDAWPGGARTNYELKYEREGRPILRLAATLRPALEDAVELVHPRGVEALVVAARAEPPDDKPSSGGPPRAEPPSGARSEVGAE